MLTIIYGFFKNIFEILFMILQRFNIFTETTIYQTLMKIVEINKINHKSNCEKVVFHKKIKVGLLTNEIPPIVYGGVATWIVNFLKMFKDDSDIEIVPIFLAYQDNLPDECLTKYPNIRVINNYEDIRSSFSDIDICINNLWIALETIVNIKELYPNLNIISVCHSLIRMENITNMGSCYTNNFNQQEITFQNSDYVVLISKAEENYYNMFGYNLFDTKTRVIYNSYTPKYDDVDTDSINYESNTLGYIGRHVPRKRPEIPIIAVSSENHDLKVINMGVDYDKYGNDYWKKLEKQYENNLVVIPFSTDEKVKENYWKDIGVNCITGIYEPFGYTICETLDRRVPVIVSDIDGPKEIIEEVKECIVTYDVDIDNYKNDIKNFKVALNRMLEISPEQRKINSEKARKCLDKLRPEVIKEEWKKLIYDVLY